MTAPHLIARSDMQRTDAGYTAESNIWGFRYTVTVEKQGERIVLSVYDGPVSEEHRIPGVDTPL